MRLVHKFTLWYLAITFAVLGVGGFIMFATFRAEVDFEEALMLRERLDHAAGRLEKGAPPGRLRRHGIEVKELDMALPEMAFVTTDTMAYHEFSDKMEKQVKVSTSRKIGGKHYYLSSFYGLVESDDITDAVVKSLSWIVLLLLALTAVLSVVISRNLLAPFDKTLQVIQSFQLKSQAPVVLPKTRTREFQKLNIFLAEMMDKAQGDYQALKEFTENASHELQTPMAIIRGKLELLLESPLSQEQACLIGSAQDALDKLSKTGQSLSLLAKIENKEFASLAPVNLSNMLEENLQALEEIIEMKNIRVEKQIAEDVKIAIHPVLGDILLSNLISNAIRHNVADGYIKVELTQKFLKIENSGLPLKEAPAEMFRRFKKGGNKQHSIGLGLAIVKRICEQNRLRISYQQEEQVHEITVLF